MKKFFAVIGNPPYQDESLGGNDRYAPQIYNTFIDESYQVADMTVLVHPGRFLFNAGSTPKAWNKKMLNDEHFCILDYKNDAREVFPNTSITGGVAISYHSHKKTFTPIEVFSPFQEVNSIRNKIVKSEDFKSLSNIVVSAYSYHFSDKLYEQYPELKGTLSDGHDYDLKSNVFDLLSDVFYDKAVESDMLAIYGRQNNDRCFKFIKKEYIVGPSNVDKYRVEPYVIAADIYSSATRSGRGGWTWYTGSAGWFYRVGLEEILGLKKRGNKLRIEPNIPISWDGYKATYHYLDTVYNVEVVKSRKESATVDGKRVTNNTVSLVNDHGIHSIIVYVNK